MDWRTFEDKWLKFWEENNVFKTTEKSVNPLYILEMFAYPSGDIHMGHFRNYTIGDAIYRYKKLKGYDLLHPFGWDAFGLPAEQAAIKHNIHPKDWTINNIKTGGRTLRGMGLSYDWGREIITCNPDYYKWTQWLFLLLYKMGLAYQSKSVVNWCETCRTILANEQAENGICWRCKNEVIKKDLENCWFFKITSYAERLLKDIEELTDWPEHVKTIQRNWIGRSEGAEVDFKIDGLQDTIRIFTTRLDTVFGVTFMTLAPEHPLSLKITKPERINEVQKYTDSAANKSELLRTSKAHKDGVFTGSYAINPFSGNKIPIWISDYVVMSYGTGAVMGVPAHDKRDFEFAKRYQLPVVKVIRPAEGSDSDCYVDDGVMINSARFSNLSSAEGRSKLIKFAEEKGFGQSKVNYRIRDWLISRQRYWGCPIPIVYCDKCGCVPVKQESLPVLLPDVKDFMPKGRSPLEDSTEYISVSCPSCSATAKRCPDTMDTFVDSSFYLFRYFNPKDESRPWDLEMAKKWLPVSLYIGGVEHASGHLLYFRFITKVLYDAGYLPVDEPVSRLFNHGMVLDKNGDIMSKSKGNVTSPAEILNEYGVDVGRMTMFFAAPSDQEVRWNPEFIKGITRFYDKLSSSLIELIDSGYGLNIKIPATDKEKISENFASLKRKIHLTIKRATLSLEKDFAFNTSIAQMMELLNLYMNLKKDLSPTNEFEKDILNELVADFIIMLQPFAPLLSEELWSRLKQKSSILQYAKWPDYDAEWAVEVRSSIPVQINGKVRDQVELDDESSDERLRDKSLNLEKIKKYVEGKSIEKFFVVRDKVTKLPKLINIVIK